MPPERESRDEPMGDAPFPDVERREDPALLTGRSRYTDDIDAGRQVYLAIRRSEMGHARLVDVDASAAESREGVVAVFTAGDVVDSGVDDDHVPTWFAPPDEDEGPYALHREMVEPRRPLLADGRVRYAGEPVAAVLAEGRYLASEAADLVDVEYDRLSATTDPREALEDGAEPIHEEAPDNLAFEWEVGDESAVDAAFAAADHVVELDLANQRVFPSAMEPRTVLASYDPGDGTLDVTMSTQVPHHTQRYLSDALGVPQHRIRVEAPDVGGGFGTKSKFYPAEGIAAWCSMQVGRPVKWTATRTEDYSAGIHGRARQSTAAMALDEGGRMLGLRVETDADLGAYLSKVAPRIATNAHTGTLSGQYAIPSVYCRVRAAFTNTAPVDAYRGAGRPESAFITERLVRAAAGELGVDPAELRRRNLLTPDEFPYETPVGSTYDSGDYERALDRLLELVDYDDLREAGAPDGGAPDGECERLVGVGLACFVEESGVGAIESATVRVHPSGTVTALAGTADQGQGHRTTFAQLVAGELELPDEAVEFREGDTDVTPQGTGTYASRSVTAAGPALQRASRRVLEKARTVAAHALEADPDDVDYGDGEFRIAGAAERSIAFEEVAALAYDPARLPEEVEPGLEVSLTRDSAESFPFGAHAAVVAVDPESGEVDLERYAAVDDCGNRINPRIVRGQRHGAIAQGVGQALYEEAVYNSSGALVSGSMQDYAVPKAEHLPEFEIDHTVTPSPTNPLGAKGIGENGSIGPPPAIVNAVVDALEPYGVDHVDMPVTDERVWRAIADAEEG